MEEINWDCSKLIESVEVNVVEIQGIWDEEDENLKSAIAVWRILPKGMSKLKKRILDDDVANITRSGKYYKPSILEKDHPGRNVEEGSKPLDSMGRKKKRRRKIGSSHKHCNAFLDALNGKEVPIETTP